MKTSARVAINAMTGWLSFALNAAIGIALVPFLIETLGKRGFGMTVLAGTVLTFSLLADMGLTHALSRQLAEAITRGQKRLCNEYVSSAAVVYFLLASAITGVLFLFEGPILSALNVPGEFYEEGRFLVRFYAPGMIFLTFYSCTSQSVLTAHKRFDAANLATAGARLIRGISLFLIVWLISPTLYGWAAGMLLGHLVRAVLLSWRAHAIHSGFRIRPWYVSRAAFAGVLSIGGVLFVIRVTGTMAVQSDPIVLSLFLGPLAVAVYSPAAQIFIQVRPLVTMVANQIHPLATSAHVEGKRAEMDQILIRGTKYTFLMGIFVVALVLVFAFPICRLWLSDSLGSDYQKTAWCLMGLALTDLLTYAAGTHWPILLGMKKLRYLMWVQVVAAVGGIALGSALVALSPLGLYGVVVAAIAFGLLRRVLIYFHICKVCQVGPWEYFRKAYLGPVAVLALLIAGNYGILRIIDPRSPFDLLLAAGGSLVLWLLATWVIGLNRSDRKSFSGLLRSFLRSSSRLLWQLLRSLSGLRKRFLRRCKRLFR